MLSFIQRYREGGRDKRDREREREVKGLERERERERERKGVYTPRKISQTEK
jgi:hypothetical protein